MGVCVHVRKSDGKMALWSSSLARYMTSFSHDNTEMREFMLQDATARANRMLDSQMKRAKTAQGRGCSKRFPFKCRNIKQRSGVKARKK